MVNARRGEIEGVIDGEPHRLVLTLGALSELEQAFAVEDLAALGARFGNGRLSARDLTRILGAGLRAGGATCSDDAVAAMDFEGGPGGALRLAVELLNATFGGKEEEAKTKPPISRTSRTPR